MEDNIRRSTCAGTWYNSNPDELDKEIQSYLENNQTQTNQNLKAIIVPHAGYMFSGNTAAKAFNKIPENINKIIILGTSHQFPLQNSSIMDVSYYQTPLGNIQLCEDAQSLKDNQLITTLNEAHLREHSIEIELPFLQKKLNHFCIIPIIVGQTDPKTLAEKLDQHITENTLIVASVDLSHFHPKQTAEELDKSSINTILDKDSNTIIQKEIDSPYGVASLLEIAKNRGWKPNLLEYKNSGDIIGDPSSVVGYSAIEFTKNGN